MFTVSEKLKFIERVFGKGNVARNMSNIEVTCPFCLEAAQKKGHSRYDKKKLAIRLSDDLVHCWVCGWKARSLVPLLKLYGTRDDLAEYKEKFLPDTRRSDQLVEAGDKKKLELPGGFRLLALLTDTRDPDVRVCLRYLKKRGLTERDLWYFKFGISSELPRRVVFPSFDSQGKLNYWTARAIDEEAKPKYVNPDKEIVSKTDIVFNEINIDWGRELVLVEGPFDVTKCPENTAPLLGNHFTEESALFASIVCHETPCVLLLDDDARIRASEAAKKLASYSVPVRVADTGGFHDPGEMSRNDVEERVKQAASWGWDSHLREKFKTIVL